MKKNNAPFSAGFSIIEILVGIFIFSLGLVSVYALMSSTLKVNTYNANYIIATNLAREQLEMVRNIRDSNYKKFQKYSTLNPENPNYQNTFQEGKYYRIENNYASGDFPIKVSDITTGFGEGEAQLNTNMKSYQLYLDGLGRYVFHTVGTQKTPFYRYIQVQKVEDINGVIGDALKIKSKVIWYQGGYHSFEISTILTDWKRL